MTKHTITITLTDAAQREALLAGDPAQREQTYTIQPETVAAALAAGGQIDAAGAVSLRGAIPLDARPADAAAAIAAVVAARESLLAPWRAVEVATLSGVSYSDLPGDLGIRYPSELWTAVGRAAEVGVYRAAAAEREAAQTAEREAAHALACEGYLAALEADPAMGAHGDGPWNIGELPDPAPSRIDGGTGRVHGDGYGWTTAGDCRARLRAVRERYEAQRATEVADAKARRRALLWQLVRAVGTPEQIVAWKAEVLADREVIAALDRWIVAAVAPAVALRPREEWQVAEPSCADVDYDGHEHSDDRAQSTVERLPTDAATALLALRAAVADPIALHPEIDLAAVITVGALQRETWTCGEAQSLAYSAEVTATIGTIALKYCVALGGEVRS